MKSKLKKDKLLSTRPFIQSAVSEMFPSDVVRASEGMAAKLESRLLSSKSLSKEVDTVISTLHSALKPSGDKASGGDDDDEGSCLSQEPQIVDVSAAANQPAAQRVSEEDSENSEDDTGGSDGSTGSDGTFQPITSNLTGNSRPVFDRASHSPLLPDQGTESVFLPALSNGFIPGGSDTDWSDEEIKAADSIRRNRRGQRARRA